MSGTEQHTQNTKFYSIVDGKLRRKVSEDTPGATLRTYTLKDGTTGAKFELVYNALFGTITNVVFQEGDYGLQLLIELDADEDGQTPIIALGATSKYAIDFLKKLPSISLEKEVRLMPYDFEDENGKRRSGFRIDHRDNDEKFTEKVENFFTEERNVSGYPNPPENASETWGKEDWKNYFQYTLPKFLREYATANVIPKIAKVEPKKVDYPKDEIDLDSIPFK